jgi:hypothetical protein
MECLNCGFENIPGTPTCVRCQSVLNLGDVGVIPRRASSLRLATRLLRVWYWARTRWPASPRWLPRWRPTTFAPVPWRALALTLVVPGLGHIQQGHRRSGLILLGLWFVFLVAAIVTVTGPLCPWSLNAAICVHAIAFIALQVANLAFERTLVRLLFGALLFLGLRWLVYLPMTGLVEHVVVPLRLYNFASGPVLSGGDGILYEGPWLRPATFARGELVTYRIAEIQGHYGHAAIFIRAGFGVDRVLGLPGERVQFKDGVLLINGAPLDPPVTPIGPWVFPRLDTKLGAGEYLIIPSQLILNVPAAYGGHVPLDMVRPLTVIPESQILGRVLLRVRPWRHAGRVH